MFALFIVLIATVLGVAASADSARGRARNGVTFWWKPVVATVHSDVATLTQNGAVSGVNLYCQFVVLPSGDFGVNTTQPPSGHHGGDHAACPAAVAAATAAGLRVNLLVGMGDRDRAGYFKAFAQPNTFAAQMATGRAFAESRGGVVRGFNFDFEPWPHGRGAAQGVAFARFLGAVRAALRRGDRPRTAVTVCANSWSTMFSNYTLLAEATDAVYDMGTYHAPDLAAFDALLHNATAMVAGKGLPAARLASGVADYAKNPWETTPASVAARFAALKSAGVVHAAVFAYPFVNASWANGAMADAWWSALADFAGVGRSAPTRFQATAATAIVRGSKGLQLD